MGIIFLLLVASTRVSIMIVDGTNKRSKSARSQYFESGQFLREPPPYQNYYRQPSPEELSQAEQQYAKRRKTAQAKQQGRNSPPSQSQQPSALPGQQASAPPLAQPRSSSPDTPSTHQVGNTQFYCRSGNEQYGNYYVDLETLQALDSPYYATDPHPFSHTPVRRCTPEEMAAAGLSPQNFGNRKLNDDFLGQAAMTLSDRHNFRTMFEPPAIVSSGSPKSSQPSPKAAPVSPKSPQLTPLPEEFFNDNYYYPYAENLDDF